jgi:hypothetical protein
MFHAVCLQIVPAKMENPDNEYIIIPVYILLIAAGIQQYITTFFLSSHVLFTMC